MTIKKSIFSKKNSEWQMMNLNNSKTNSGFKAIFDPSHHYENYPDKKNVYKESILVAASSPSVNSWIVKITIGPLITV